MTYEELVRFNKRYDHDQRVIQARRNYRIDCQTMNERDAWSKANAIYNAVIAEMEARYGKRVDEID